MGSYFLLLSSSLAQDQTLADSLKSVYEKTSEKDSNIFEILRALAFNEITDYNLSLSYADKLIDLSKRQNREDYLFYGLYQRGNKKKILGDFSEALSAYLSSAAIAEELGNMEWEGNSFSAIASLYAEFGNHPNAMLYYNEAISILRVVSDSISLASTILNAGDEYLTHGDYDSALIFFKESGDIFKQLNYQIGTAYNLGNIGMVYANTGKNYLAEKNINKAIKILEEAGDFYPICFYLISMSEVFLDRGDISTSIEYAEKSLNLAIQYELKQQISDANLKLSELHNQLGKAEESFDYYKNHIAYRDSVNNLETIQSMADQRTEFEVSLREKEILVLEKDKELQNIYIIVALVLLLAFILLFLLSRQRLITNKLATKAERDQHEKDVQNLLQGQEKKTLQSMIEGREKERKHLAGELHNHLGSLLATVKMNLNGFEQEDDRISTLHHLVDQVYNDVRNMSHALNMGVSEDFGLVSALKELVEHLSQSGKLKIEFNAAVSDCSIPFEQEIVLYRVVQELVSNVLKHAKATEMTLLLTCFEDDQLLNIMVSDNGKGFDAEAAKVKADGMGLFSLEGMVQGLHGEMEIDSQPGKGTTINIDFPLDEAMTENPIAQ